MVLVREGGTNLKECIQRLIDRILTLQMQGQFNRTGNRNKIAFQEILEPIVKGIS